MKSAGKKYHSTAMTKALEIVGGFGKVDNAIDYQNNKDIQDRHKIYTHRL